MKEYNWPEITAETPIEELQRIHKDIWQYVIENGEKPETPYTNSCVGCTYAILLRRKVCPSALGTFCRLCPIDWGDNNDCCISNSLYQHWLKACRWSQEEADLAAEIRDIPFKKENTYEQD